MKTIEIILFVAAFLWIFDLSKKIRDLYRKIDNLESENKREDNELDQDV